MQAPHVPHISASSAKATALVVLSALCFGSISLLTILTTREGMSILSIVFWRFVFAAMVLLAIAQEPVRRHWRDGWRLFLIGGLIQAACTYISLSALRFVPASVVAFLFFTYPAWLALTSAARGTDPLTAKRAGVLAVAMTGLALMIGIPGVGPNVHLDPVGIALGLGAALLYSTYLPIVNHLQRSIPPIPAVSYIILGATVAFFVMGFVQSPPWGASVPTFSALALPPTNKAWIYVLLLAVVSTVVAFLGLLAGLRTLGSTRTSIIATTEPFFTTLLVAVFLAERLRWTTLVGGAFIAAAVVAISLESEPAAAD